MSTKDIFGTKESFLVAAASYFGLPDDQVQGSTVEVGADGTLDVVLRVSLTPDDMTGIADRMKAQQEKAPEPVQAPIVVANEQRLRDEYNGMDKRAKSEFGSFSRYKAWRLGGGAEVTTKVELPAHVYLSPAEATPQQRAMAIGQDEKGNYTVAVEDLTEEQSRLLIDLKDMGASPEELQREYTNPVDDKADRMYLNPRVKELIAEELAQHFGVPAADQLRAGYIERTMDAHARLNGADGKPTSNADDFSGLPG